MRLKSTTRKVVGNSEARVSEERVGKQEKPCLLLILKKLTWKIDIDRPTAQPVRKNREHSA